MRILTWAASLIAGIFLLASVSSADGKSGNAGNSGFLGDAYSKMKQVESPSKAKVKRWISPDIAPGKYEAIWLEKTVLYPAPQGTEQASVETLNAISAYLDEALRRELTGGIKLVSGPGPNTLHLKPAITAVGGKDMGLKPYQYLPFAFIATGGQSAKKASLAVEYEIQDAETSEVVAVGMREDTGQDIKKATDRLTLENVKPAIDLWAKDARAFIEAARVKK